MKINGKQLDSPGGDILVFPRIDEDIVIKIGCVLDYEPFNVMIPLPKPPKVQLRGQTAWTPNVEDPKYNEELDKYSALKTHWMVLKSLEINEDLEWETVDMADPETWKNYIKELETGGFCDNHVAKIINTVAAVNGLNEDMMEAAKKRFLAMQLAQEQQSSLQDAADSTSSGDAVSDSD